MDRKQAQELIKETFGAAFDKGRFTNFIINLLNLKAEQIEHKRPYSGNFIRDPYEQYISTLERIAKYTDGEHKIDILIAKLKKETSIERARTMQRNFIAWYLNGSRGGELKDAALVAFVAPNEEDWRFSLVKMDYRFEESKKGRMRVKEEFTPARRWSFLVGANENSHTAQSQLVDLVADDERNPTHAQLEEAFNIEKVTKEFFEKYRELFLWTKETIDEVVKKDKKIREDFEAKGVNTVDFSKKLLGQIVFLYFLQKKGWFGVKRDADWGTGPKNFLRELFERKHGTYKNFFNDILEPLFYEALAWERDDDFYSRFNCKIPFLNGGLFDPINNYDWVHTDILLPNDLFSNDYKTKEGDNGNGILDIFDRYNFTVKEDEPLEKEVAVDPEMLGKVFENLLEVKDRKSKGTYYTPREIVHYMCQQSVINYVATELEGKVSKEDIETLIKHGEHLGENETTVEAKGRETNTYFYKLPEGVRQNAELIDKKLINIKVCDPAIGSGAFPVGMMGEIVKTRNVLTAYIKGKDRTIYNFKRECIEKSLYGVDIDPGAVEIAKLRLWLSLVVDEDDIEQIKPLPNLDYKIVCGNSLLGVEKDLFNSHLFSELERLKPLLFNEINPKKKQEYKKQIDELIVQITHGHKEFDFEIYFSEVFHEKKGFDLVITNPPYVNTKRGIDEKSKAFFSTHYVVAKGQYDLFTLFIEKALYISRIISFIVPKPFINNENYSEIRKKVIANGIISIVIGSYVFESAGVESCVFISSKNTSDLFTVFDFLENQFVYRNKCYVSFCETLPFNIINTEIGINETPLFNKILNGTNKLYEILDMTRGIECGKDDDCVTTIKQKYKLLRGEDVTKYCVSHNGYYIIYDKSDSSKFKPIHLYTQPKILIRRVADDIISSYDENSYLVLNAIYCGVAKNKNYNLKFLTAILNSQLISFWFKKMFILTDKLFPYVRMSQLNFIPIVKASLSSQQPFVGIVDNIFRITKDKDYLQNLAKQAKVKEYERQINQMVYGLYGLNKKEIEIVEKSLE